MLPFSHLLSNSTTYPLGETDIEMLKMVLFEGKHDRTYKASFRFIIALIDASVRLGVNTGKILNLLLKYDYTTEAAISGINIMTKAIELNRKITMNWLTSRIKNRGAYRQAIMAIAKSQHHESETMFSHALA